MAMNNQLLAVVQHIESERGVSREIVLTAIEQAISQAARKNHEVTNDLRVVIDRKDLSLHVFDTLVCSDEDTGPGFITCDRAARFNHGNPIAEGETIGLYIEPDAIHIMEKSEYSGMFGDYSSFSNELDELSNAESEDDE